VNKVKILLARLIQNSKLDITKDFAWNGQPITLQNIQEAIQNNIKGTSDPFGDLTWYQPKSIQNNEYHISRVIYFIEHPHEIKDIEIEEQYWHDKYSHWTYPNSSVIDGNHRLLATIYLNLKEIDIAYMGIREDILNYLTGVTDIEPTEII